MVSKDNLKAISKQGYTYISALDRDEIPNLRFLEDDFPELVGSKDWKENLTKWGFVPFDDDLLYREHNRISPLSIPLTTAKGQMRTVNTFSITYEIRHDILRTQSFLDGITCFVTNKPHKELSARDAIWNYCRKNKVEEAFHEIKGHLSLRPFYLRRDKRVRAHVSICVLGYFYFLNNSVFAQGYTRMQSYSDVHRIHQLGAKLP